MDKNKIIRYVYYLIKRLGNALIAFISELFKQTSYLKGDDFEKCIRKKIYTKSRYVLVMKTHDFHENSKDYVESSLYPDYLFRDKKSNKEFFVEAKYRDKVTDGKIKWCNDSQLKRYKKIGKETHVIIAIGLYGRPANPKHIFLVPLDEIEYCDLYTKFLANYEYTENRKNLIDDLMDRVYNISKTR